MSSQRSDIKCIVILELCCKDLKSKEGGKNVWWPMRKWEEVREGRKNGEKRDQVDKQRQWLLLLISTCELQFKRMKRKHLLRALQFRKAANFLANELLLMNIFPIRFPSCQVFGYDTEVYWSTLSLMIYEVFVFWQTFCIHGMHFEEKSIL